MPQRSTTARLEPRARNSTQTSHMGDRDLSTSGITSCLQGVHVRKKLELEAELGLEPRHSGKECRHPSQHLGCSGPCSYVGNVDGVPGSWLLPGCLALWGVNEWMPELFLSCSLYLSNQHIRTCYQHCKSDAESDVPSLCKVGKIRIENLLITPRLSHPLGGSEGFLWLLQLLAAHICLCLGPQGSPPPTVDPTAGRMSRHH